MQQRSVRLNDFKHVVVADLGATLELFKLAGREFGPSCSRERPERIEDCIAALGVEECVGAISAPLLPNHSSQAGFAEFWEHSRSIAQYCRLIAENTAEINPDQAYIVGLLHGIGSLPILLGWKGAGSLSNSVSGLRVAQLCSVPDSVTDYLNDLHLARRTCVWSDIVRMAHRSVCTPAGIHRRASCRPCLGGTVTGRADPM